MFAAGLFALLSTLASTSQVPLHRVAMETEWSYAPPFSWETMRNCCDEQALKAGENVELRKRLRLASAHASVALADYAQANQTLDAEVADDPDCLRTRLKKAIVALHPLRTEGVDIDAIEAGLAAFGDDDAPPDDYLFVKAIVEGKRDQFERSLQTTEKLLRQNSIYPNSHRLLVICHSKLRPIVDNNSVDFVEITRISEGGLFQFPTGRLEPLLRQRELSMFHLYSRYPAHAELLAYLSAGVACDPNDSDILLRLATWLSASGKPYTAQYFAQRLANDLPEVRIVADQRQRIAYMVALPVPIGLSPDKAVESLTAILAEKDLPALHLLRGHYALRAGQYAQAIRDFEISTDNVRDYEDGQKFGGFTVYSATNAVMLWATGDVINPDDPGIEKAALFVDGFLSAKRLMPAFWLRSEGWRLAIALELGAHRYGKRFLSAGQIAKYRTAAEPFLRDSQRRLAEKLETIRQAEGQYRLHPDDIEVLFPIVPWSPEL